MVTPLYIWPIYHQRSLCGSLRGCGGLLVSLPRHAVAFNYPAHSTRRMLVQLFRLHGSFYHGTTSTSVTLVPARADQIIQVYNVPLVCSFQSRQDRLVLTVPSISPLFVWTRQQTQVGPPPITVHRLG
jgi:hypothetical protein